MLHNCYLCGRDFPSLMRGRICNGCRDARPVPALNVNLTFREKQVVALVVRAMANKEIAFELHLSEGTIKEYLNRIFHKLGVSNRTALAVWAMRRPVVEVPA